MDVCLVIKQRMKDLGLEQKDLAAATEVTESYISQLLTRKKLPPAPVSGELIQWRETIGAAKRATIKNSNTELFHWEFVPTLTEYRSEGESWKSQAAIGV